MKNPSNFRPAIQTLSALAFNADIKKMVTGGLHTSKAKGLCVPVLNCYSCPSAIGSCPIGSLQNVNGQTTYKIAFYTIGLILVFSILLARLICGFLCPFGFFQDLLHKIPTPKVKVKPSIDKPARYIKYVVLGVMVIILPLFLLTEYGGAIPYFCKYVCPAGTFQAGIPQLLLVPALRQGAGLLFNWKVFLLVLTVIGSVAIPRFFCRYFCPLGAIYSLFNKVALYQMKLDKSTCIDCGKCEEVCPMVVPVRQDINHRECIRCSKCKHVCPTQAISSGFEVGKQVEKESVSVS